MSSVVSCIGHSNKRELLRQGPEGKKSLFVNRHLSRDAVQVSRAQCRGLYILFLWTYEDIYPFFTQEKQKIRFILL